MNTWTLIGLLGGLALIAFVLIVPLAAPKPRPGVDRVLGIDQPGDVLTAVPADMVLPLRRAVPADCKGSWNQPCRTSPECGYHQPPRARRLHVEQLDAFDELVAANPDLTAIDFATLADLYLLPQEGP